MKICYWFLMVAILSGYDLFGQSALPLERVDRPIVVSFDDFRGTFESLPVGFAVSKDGTNIMVCGDSDFRGVSRGGVTTGGCYAWLISEEEYALGFQPTAEKFTPGFFQLVISNCTGRAIRHVVVSYFIVWNNNADRSSSFELTYSTNGVHFTEVAGSFFVTPASRSDCFSWASRQFCFLITLGSPVGDGELVWLRWVGDDAGGSGSRDEYGIDRVSVAGRSSLGTVFAVF